MAYDAETEKLLAAVASGVRSRNVGAVLRLTRRLADERDEARAAADEAAAGLVQLARNAGVRAVLGMEPLGPKD